MLSVDYTKSLLESNDLSVLELSDGWYLSMGGANWPKWGQDSIWYQPETISVTNDLNQAVYFSNEVCDNQIINQVLKNYKGAKIRKVGVSFGKTIKIDQIMNCEPKKGSIGLLVQVLDGWYLTYQGLNWPKWADIDNDFTTDIDNDFTTDEVGITSNLSKAFRFDGPDLNDVFGLNNEYLYFIKSIVRNFSGASLIEVSVTLLDQE